ncbi:RimK family alpha-L-glutamate ligase [Chungangia koreensis]|uniref:RimK family alpha-L-glutamate ligase n=1 Tax=Chungangia koreensis TaxID=752657 RepID=A0ABV8X440_9LACT
MKGYLFYELADAERNSGFIEALKSSAEGLGIQLHLVHHEGQILNTDDFILYRSRNHKLAKKLEAMGHRLINRAEVNVIANDKLKTVQMVQLLGIQTVPTTRLKEIDELRHFPIVLKTVDGHGGQEVELCHNRSEAEEFINVMEGKIIIAQPYIETESTDVRVFVIGDEVVGAVKRTGVESFKSNFTLGGNVERFELSGTQEEEALKIARALKSDYIGIDFLLLPDGTWMLNEIEDPVGARSFYETHDTNIAELLMEHIKKVVSG